MVLHHHYSSVMWKRKKEKLACYVQGHITVLTCVCVCVCYEYVIKIWQFRLSSKLTVLWQSKHGTVESERKAAKQWDSTNMHISE